MQKIIKGIVYDTETSRELGSHYDKLFGETDTLYVTQEEEYFLTLGKRNIVPLNDKALLKYWIAKNLDAEASERILNIRYSILVVSYIDDDICLDQFEPQSQSWKDIENCFGKACYWVEDKYPSLEHYCNWKKNDFLPACMYRDDNGNRAEVYVCYEPVK